MTTAARMARIVAADDHAPRPEAASAFSLHRRAGPAADGAVAPLATGGECRPGATGPVTAQGPSGDAILRSGPGSGREAGGWGLASALVAWGPEAAASASVAWGPEAAASAMGLWTRLQPRPSGAHRRVH